MSGANYISNLCYHLFSNIISKMIGDGGGISIHHARQPSDPKRRKLTLFVSKKQLWIEETGPPP